MVGYVGSNGTFAGLEPIVTECIDDATMGKKRKVHVLYSSSGDSHAMHCWLGFKWDMSMAAPALSCTHGQCVHAEWLVRCCR